MISVVKNCIILLFLKRKKRIKKFLFDLYFLALYNKLIVIKVESEKLSHKKDMEKKEVRIYGK